MSSESTLRAAKDGALALVLLITAAVACEAGGETPAWKAGFGYEDGALRPIDIRDYGFPFLPVQVAGRTVWLPFDTGNMSGMVLESDLFAELGLPCSERANRYDSGGALIGSPCVASGVPAEVYGVSYDSLRVYEFSLERLPGLVGPGVLPGTRFTLDYGRELMAVDQGVSPPEVSGFEGLELVRSPEHPRLILVRGELQGREILIEIDTGKSRTTVDQGLVESLGLRTEERGVELGRVTLGSRTFDVSSARVVSTAGISAGLPLPVAVGIGSDILSEFVFTVDYEAGQLWIESTAR